MLATLNARRDGRAAALELRTRPEAGGWLYATSIVDSCAAIVRQTDILDRPQLDLTTISPENQSKAIAAFDFLKARCAQFTDEEFDKYSTTAVLRQHGRDPLFALVTDYVSAMRAADIPVRAHRLSRVLQAADPVVIDDLGMRLSLYSDASGGYLYFDGEKTYIRDEPALIGAYYLLPCGLGLACDATDPTLALLCVTADKCYANRFERALSEMSGGDRTRYDAIVATYQRLLRAVENADAAKFVPR